MVECEGVEHLRLRRRGNTALELKVRYLLQRNVPREDYSLNVEFIIPYSLNVTPANYGTEAFYDSRKLYVRFDTPRIEMESLLDPGEEESPLARTENATAAILNGEEPSRTDFVYESKMLGAVYKSLLRDSFRAVDPDDEAHVTSLIASAALVPDRFHRVVRALAGCTDDMTVGHARLIDEHLSLLLERYLLDLVDRSSAEAISEMIRAESAYRSEQHYETGRVRGLDEVRLEEYVFHEKQLKNYVSEVLFFRVRESDQRIRIQHITYAAAAGLAMAVATGIAFYGQSQFGSFTTSLFIVLVLGYMLKDRVKDVFRDLFMRSIGRRFYDRRESLYDPVFRTRLATVRERAGFAKRPRRRSEQPKPRAIGSWDRRTRFVYTKRITLHASTLRRIHRRVRGVADTSIIDIQPMLHAAARLYGTVPIEQEDGTILPQRAKRIYHIDMIVTYSDADGPQVRNVVITVAHGRIQRVTFEKQPVGSRMPAGR